MTFRSGDGKANPINIDEITPESNDENNSKTNHIIIEEATPQSSDESNPKINPINIGKTPPRSDDKNNPIDVEEYDAMDDWSDDKIRDHLLKDAMKRKKMKPV